MFNRLVIEPGAGEAPQGMFFSSAFIVVHLAIHLIWLAHLRGANVYLVAFLLAVVRIPHACIHLSAFAGHSHFVKVIQACRVRHTARCAARAV